MAPRRSTRLPLRSSRRSRAHPPSSQLRSASRSTKPSRRPRFSSRRFATSPHAASCQPSCQDARSEHAMDRLAGDPLGGGPTASANANIPSSASSSLPSTHPPLAHDTSRRTIHAPVAATIDASASKLSRSARCSRNTSAMGREKRRARQLTPLMSSQLVSVSRLRSSTASPASEPRCPSCCLQSSSRKCLPQQRPAKTHSAGHRRNRRSGGRSASVVKVAMDSEEACANSFQQQRVTRGGTADGWSRLLL